MPKLSSPLTPSLLTHRAPSTGSANESCFPGSPTHTLGLVGVDNPITKNLSTTLNKYVIEGANVKDVIHAAINFLDAISKCDAARSQSPVSQSPVRSQSPGLISRVKAKFFISPSASDVSDVPDPKVAANENLFRATESFSNLLKLTFNPAIEGYEAPIATPELQKIALEILQAADRDGVATPGVRTPTQDNLPRTGESIQDEIVRNLSSKIRSVFKVNDGVSDGYDQEQFNKDYSRGGKDRHYFGDGKFARDCIQFHQDDTTPKLPDHATYEDVLRIMLVQQQFATVHGAVATQLNLSSTYNGSLSNATYYYGNSYSQGGTVSINCRVVFAERGVDTSRFKDFNPDGTLNIPPEYSGKFVASMEYTYVFDAARLDNVISHLKVSASDKSKFVKTEDVKAGCLRTINVSALEMRNVRLMDSPDEPSGEAFDITRTQLSTCQFTSREFSTSLSTSTAASPASTSFGGAAAPAFRLDPNESERQDLDESERENLPKQGLERKNTLPPTKFRDEV